MGIIKKEKNSMSSGYKPKNQNVLKLERFLKQKDGKFNKLG